MSDNLQKIYAEWIEQICKRFGLSRTQIAKRVGLSPSTITRQTKLGWTKSPQLRIIRLVADEFGVDPPPALLGGDNARGGDAPSTNDRLDLIGQVRDIRVRITENQFSVASINRRIDRLELRLEEVIEVLRKRK